MKYLHSPIRNLKSFHRGCGMWNFYLWNGCTLFACSQPLWKSVKNSTDGCGEKVVEALRKNGLFHINFP